MTSIVEDFCGVDDVTIPFSNALGRYTSCFVDTLILGLCHMTGFLVMIWQWRRWKHKRFECYRLKHASMVYQWTAFLASLLCFGLPLLEFGARMGENQILISPQNALAPYEYLSFVLSLLFWFVAFMMLYRELSRFTWDGLWTIRFSLCLVAAGQIAKFSFVVNPDLTEIDVFYVLYMIAVAGHVYLVIFAITQFPASTNTIPLSFIRDDYEELPQGPTTEIELDVCPEQRVNFLSRLLFIWISPFLRQGFKRPLEFDDIWQLDVNDRAETLLSKFSRHWNEERQWGHGRGPRRWRQPSLHRAIRKTVGFIFLQALPLKLIVDASQFSGSMFLKQILRSVDKNEPDWKAYTFAVSMFIGMLIGILAENVYFQLVMRAGFRLRSIITSEVQRKSLYLSPTDRMRFSTGQIFNFVASDAEAFQLVCQNLLTVISAPLRMITATVLLSIELGPSSLVAVGVLILIVPIQAQMVRWSASYIRQALKQTDERTKLESELVSGIDAVKCNAWEEPFWTRIVAVRTRELAILWRSFILASINIFVVTSVPAVVSVSTFGVYVLLGNDLTATKAFVSLTLFEVLRFPMFQLPQVITQITQANVSIKRVENFLKSEEQPERSAVPPVPTGETAISVNGDFAWDINKGACLSGLKLDIKSGSLTAIVGPTGSGKSSVLSSIIGLMQRLSGPATVVHGRLCLVPQTPFIINATIKDNILFGEEYDEHRYQEAIRVASLIPDLQIFPGGDETELGEKGINISGGQKQRIALARAVYSNADICLLDDPLSALDAHVGRDVFHECITGVLKEKTVVLVTNQLQYVHAVDRIIFIQNGKIAEEGTYNELMAVEKGAFAQMMSEALVEEESSTTDHRPTTSKPTVTETPATTASTSQTGTANVKESQLVQKERRSIGIVSFSVIRSYANAMGGFGIFASLVLMYIIGELVRVGATVWLKQWTSEGDDADHSQMFYMAIYGAILLTQVALNLLNNLRFRYLGTVAADALHKNMLGKLIRAPMAFYHTTPVGRIINRLSKDTGEIDKTMVDFVAFFIRTVLQLCSTLILVGAMTPLTLPFMVPMLLLFFTLYMYFQSSAREIKRLDALSRSPVYSSLNDSLNGLATIRAFGSEERLIQRHKRLVDDNIVMALLNQSINRWLSIRLETLGGLAALTTALLTIEQGADPSYMGLVISFALTITASTAITVRLASLAEQSFNAVERVAEYAEIEEEASAVIEGSTPDDWPDQGGMTFNDVKMSYRPGLPLVLRGLTAKIEPRQRIGVVGRTGAGKSSLMNSLFRVAELTEGYISIDGINTSNIGLRQLRSKIAIIPQVPFLFAGTIRINLDPFNDHTDQDLWLALDRAHLGNVVRNHGGGLDMELHEGGSPLSTGQIQLLSLARAIVRDTKILILDEATANVDMDTDALIQQTIKAEFSNKTVIAIAHRLHTIIDGDKVMVLDKGILAEFDTPANLLRNPTGIFSCMVRDTGKDSERFLRSVAFGEVDIKDVRANDAAKGLERMSSVRSSTSVGWTNDLLNNARQALSHISTLREQLINNRRQRQSDAIFNMDIEEVSRGATMSSEMQDALKIMRQIEVLAKETKALLKYDDTTLLDPSILSTPMIETIGISSNARQWNVQGSPAMDEGVATPPSLRLRRSSTFHSDRQDSI